MWKYNKKVGEGGPVEGMGVGGCEPRIEVIVKMQKQSRGSVGGSRVGIWWGSGGCEVVIIVKMQKKSRGCPVGGSGGCEPRIEEVIVEMKNAKKSGVGSG